jgi:hypothetical protein
VTDSRISKGSNSYPASAFGYESLDVDQLKVTYNATDNKLKGNVKVRAGRVINITNTDIASGANFLAYIDPVFSCSNGSSNTRQGDEIVPDSTAPQPLFVQPDADAIENSYYTTVVQALQQKTDSITTAVGTQQQSNNHYIPVDTYVAQQPSVIETVTLSPNPFSDLLQVNISYFQSTQVDVRISNTFGQTVIQKHIAVSNSSSVFTDTVNTSTLNPGIYYCIISTSNGAHTLQIIK